MNKNKGRKAGFRHSNKTKKKMSKAKTLLYIKEGL